MPSLRRLVLVEPPYVFWDRRMDRLRENEESIPGVGMLTLAAVAREKGYDVSIVDAKGSGETVDDVARRIGDIEPDVVGFSATTISITNADRIAQRIKTSHPDCLTVVGGPHVSAIPERTLAAFPALDYGIVGEGETSFFQLLEALGARADPSATGGLVWRENGGIRTNPRTPYLADLDSLTATRVGPRPGLSVPVSPFSSQLSPLSRGHPGNEPGMPLFMRFLRPIHLGENRPVSQHCKRRFALSLPRRSGCSARDLLRRSLHGAAEAGRRALRSVSRGGVRLHLELQQPSESPRCGNARADEVRPDAGRSPMKSSRGLSGCSTSSSARSASRECARRFV